LETTAATYARPEIWTRREDFERLVLAYDAECGKLLEAAMARKLPDMRRQFNVVRSQCVDCYEGFVPPGAGTRRDGSDKGIRVEDRAFAMESHASR
jgi:hypothetical protein